MLHFLPWQFLFSYVRDLGFAGELHGATRIAAVKTETACGQRDAEVVCGGVGELVDHLYDLHRTASLHNGEIKQVEFLTANAVPVTRRYEFEPWAGLAYPLTGANEGRWYGVGGNARVTVEFPVEVRPESSATLTYTVHYTW